MKQRSNTDVRGREYIGNFQDAFMGIRDDQKHTLEVRVKIDGTVAMILHFLDISKHQTSHAIMLTNEQRKDLAQFLTEDEPELWVDLKV